MLCMKLTIKTYLDATKENNQLIKQSNYIVKAVNSYYLIIIGKLPIVKKHISVQYLIF